LHVIAGHEAPPSGPAVIVQMSASHVPPDAAQAVRCAWVQARAASIGAELLASSPPVET